MKARRFEAVSDAALLQQRRILPHLPHLEDCPSVHLIAADPGDPGMFAVTGV